MPPTNWPTSRSTRPCTSRRSRPWPATSGRAGGRAGRPCASSSGPTRNEPASPTRQGHRCEMRTRPAGLSVVPAEPGLDPAAHAGYPDHPPRMGFFTDTSVCIGCKACEVACKEWNAVPEDGLLLTGMSYDNTRGLGASTWRHVAFIEKPADEAADLRWLISSNLSKPSTHPPPPHLSPT